MPMRSWIRNVYTRPIRKAPHRARPVLEELESRNLLSGLTGLTHQIDLSATVAPFSGQNNQGQNANNQGQNANNQGQNANNQGQDANSQGQNANNQGQNDNSQGQDANNQGQNQQ
jgi:hypothetical protein